MSDDPRYEAALDRETAAEEALEAAREALEGSDCPREQRIAAAVISAQWPRAARAAA